LPGRTPTHWCLSGVFELKLAIPPSAVARVRSRVRPCSCASALASAHTRWHRSGCTDRWRALLTSGSVVPSMYQGRQAASAQAAGDRFGPMEPTVSAPPTAGRRRRIGLAPIPEAAPAARAVTVASPRRWQLDVLIEDAVVVASELATNAIRHGTPAAKGGATGEVESGRVELSWCLQASRLICVVTDQTGTPPALAAGGPEAESGH